MGAADDRPPPLYLGRYRIFGEGGPVDEPLLVAVLVNAGVVPPVALSPCAANIASLKPAGGLPAEASATTETGVPPLNDVEM